jgi:RNA polymerase sigma factor (sigma-70 family)
MNDIIQDGFIGLIRGIDKFNPDLPNSNFISYIANYIRFHIKNAYRRNEQPENGHNKFLASNRFESFGEQHENTQYIDNFEEIALKAIEHTELKNILKKIFKRILTQVEIDIIETHYGLNGSPLTLNEIAKIYGCTCENIRQKEARAFRKLHRAKSSVDNTVHKLFTDLKRFL